MTSKTPGMLFCVCLQNDPSIAKNNGDALTWRVVPISVEQGRAMKNRGVEHIYAISTQAYAVAKRLNEE